MKHRHSDVLQLERLMRDLLGPSASFRHPRGQAWVSPRKKKFHCILQHDLQMNILTVLQTASSIWMTIYIYTTAHLDDYISLKSSQHLWLFLAFVKNFESRFPSCSPSRCQIHEHIRHRLSNALFRPEQNCCRSCPRHFTFKVNHLVLHLPEDIWINEPPGLQGNSKARSEYLEIQKWWTPKMSGIVSLSVPLKQF